MSESVTVPVAAAPTHIDRDRKLSSHLRGPVFLGALGVVFGDIGTSPLYALKACFAPEYGLAMTGGNVEGLVSLIVWTLIFIVSIKYVAFIMRADNHGEGGILALLALLLPSSTGKRENTGLMNIVTLGLIGTALLYGDGVITPAISVLSAVEGMKVTTPALSPFVVPVSLAILVVLFAAQRFGTGKIGRVFGPLMLLWFVVIGVLGAVEIVRTPRSLEALDPLSGLHFLAAHGVHALLVLGAVVLAVTGAEALYADMGHFGKRPIRQAWFWIVFPSLVLNYLGQGALLLRLPHAVENPFFLLAPPAILLPLVVLSTLATIVASQALITGAFSLTQQAMQLGFAPRMRSLHTSSEAEGQIYIPTVNTVLMTACLLLVVSFRSSDRLAAAYGIAVTGTMAVTSVLFYAVARSRWGWSAPRAGLVTVVFLIVDLTFFGTNLLKFVQGGWIPIVIAAAVFILMSTWHAGHECLLDLRRRNATPLEELFRILREEQIARVPGTGVFFTAHGSAAPAMVLRLMRTMRALHDHVILLSVVTVNRPEIPIEEGLTVERLSHGFIRATARVGFMEMARAEDIVRAIHASERSSGSEVVYFLARDHVRPTRTTGMVRWRKQLFTFMSRNAGSAVDFFHVPTTAVIELGAEVEI